MPVVSVDVGGVLGGIGQLARDLRAAITGKEPINAEKAAEIALKVEELNQKQQEAENSLLLAQAEINKIDATSTRFWNSGWRPAVGWVCAAALAFTYWPRAIIILVVWAKTAATTGTLAAPPDLGLADLIALLANILGLGVMRTYEKSKGTA